MQITWHRRARHDLQAVRESIAEVNPGAARQVAQRILHAVGLLAEQPSLGRPGRVPETRELVITSSPISRRTVWWMTRLSFCAFCMGPVNGRNACERGCGPLRRSRVESLGMPHRGP